MEAKKRNNGIELLRLISMFMVCLLHTLDKGGILSNCQVENLNYKVFCGIEAASICAVDIFAIISGYVASDKHTQKYEKIVSMWMQVFFYSFVLTIILAVLKVSQSITIIRIIKSAFPLLSSKYWYFTGYFVLFFAMPLLNKYLFSIDKNSSKKMLIIMYIMFGFTGFVIDPFVLKGGYSALWLIVLYCIGVLVKRIELFADKSMLFLVGTLILCDLFIWGGYMISRYEFWLSYVSPLVLTSAILWVVIFTRLQFDGTMIGKFAPLAFGVYLFQLNNVIWNDLIKDAFAFCADKNTIVGVIYVFVIAAGIYASGMAVEFIRVKLFSLLRIQLAAEWVVAFIGNCLNRMTRLLN